MDKYTFEYVVDDVVFYWRCQADDYEHAVEQLEDNQRTLEGKITSIKLRRV